MTLLASLIKVCNKLEKVNIAYMVSGSFAIGAYATPRSSNDVDLVVNLNAKTIDALLAEFNEDEYYFHIEAIKEEVSRKGFFNIIDKISGNKIDFIVLKNHPYKQLEFERKQKHNFIGTDLWIVSLEDLIIAKLNWMQELYSDKQKDDIENLLRFTNPDFDYIRKWCSNLNLNTYDLI